MDWENDGFIRLTEYGIKRPLYSLDDKYAFSLHGFNSSGKIRYFTDGVELFNYKAVIEDYFCSNTISRGRSLKKDFTIGIRRRKEIYNYNSSDYNLLVPPNLSETRISIITQIGKYEYKTTTLLDNFGNVEDLTFGWQLKLSIERSFNIFDGDLVRDYGSAEMSAALEYPKDVFISSKVSISFRYNNDFENIAYRSTSCLYLKYPYRFVSALKLRTRFYGKPDYYIHNYIGGENGLRGYDNYQLSGKNFVVMNLEQRYYSPIDILTVAVGAAAFLDAGKIWNEGDVFVSSTWNTDIGIGLRFGLTKSTNFKVVRIDMAKPLGGGQYYLSFGTEMYFNFGS